MKHIILTSLIILVFIKLDAQIQGLSASKLGTYNSEPVAKSSLEFEPSLLINFQKSKLINSENETVSNRNSEFGFRLTYGIYKNIEIGAFIPSDLHSVSIAIKTKFYENKYLKSSIFTGTNLKTNPEVNYFVRDCYHNTDNYGLGLALSILENKKFSADVNYQLSKTLKTTIDNHVINHISSVDLGYNIFEKIHLVTSYLYSNNRFENNIEKCQVVNFGLTYESDNKFIIVLNSPIEILPNDKKYNYGIGFAITFIFD